MTCAQAGQWLRYFQRRFIFVPDRDHVSKLWQALVEARNVTGFRAHDVRLVAAMQSYGITLRLKFNAAHFRGLPIMFIDPNSS
ncbi:MAG TPA: hypothetical protein VGZ47_08265 [Gemmataceae bacterium]|jgi:hypothetical protein|nr:hypothetical protein [Gemmataceae bacterium]